MVANLHPPKRGPLCLCRFRLSACGDLRAIRRCDRCRASVCTGPKPADFLRQHRPPLPDLSPEQVRQIEEAVAQGWREEQVDQAEVMGQMQEQRARVGRLMAWLDMCPDAQERGRD